MTSHDLDPTQDQPHPSLDQREHLSNLHRLAADALRSWVSAARDSCPAEDLAALELCVSAVSGARADGGGAAMVIDDIKCIAQAKLGPTDSEQDLDALPWE